MGRHRKSLEQHVLDGTYRADRHGPMPEVRNETPPKRVLSKREEQTLYPYLDATHLPKLLISADALSKLFDVKRATVRRWARNGDMPKPHTIGGSVRWDAHEIREWIYSGCPDRDGETNGTEQ